MRIPRRSKSSRKRAGRGWSGEKCSVLTGAALLSGVSLLATAHGGSGEASVSAERSSVRQVDDLHLPSGNELDANTLDGIRGRYASIRGLDADMRSNVILWDESSSGRSGHTSGGGQTRQGSNQQRQSLRTTSIR